MRLVFTKGAIFALTALCATSALADADDGVGKIKFGVPQAQTALPTPTAPLVTQIDPDFVGRLLVTGTDPLENPSSAITRFGYLSTGARTEPDINTYLVLPRNPGGPTPGYDYGRRFLFQGHEASGNIGYVTRINLDVRDPAHRITLLTPADAQTGLTGLNELDGSSFNPFTQTLLFTEENNASDFNGTGHVNQLTLSWPPVFNNLGAFIGLGGFEGIHVDNKGTLYIAEDIGGIRPRGVATVDGTPNVALNAAAQPNSFIYRYIPNNPARLEDGGKLQALQISIDGAPLTFHQNNPVGDIIAPEQKKLNTLGTSYPIKWVDVHVSNRGDTASFVATSAAKAAGATPLKRPENLAFLPGSDFRTFFISVTGDTDAPTAQVPQLAARGSWGSIFRIDLRGDGDNDRDDRDDRFRQGRSEGKISIVVLGDQDHASFDNVYFANERQLLAAEDRGDTLHRQLQKLDFVWAFDVKNGNAVRFIALGRDPSSATGTGDNEPTGVIVSNGSPRREALVGTEAALEDARGFFTQQHGDNNVYEFFNWKHPTDRR